MKLRCFSPMFFLWLYIPFMALGTLIAVIVLRGLVRLKKKYKDFDKK